MPLKSWDIQEGRRLNYLRHWFQESFFGWFGWCSGGWSGRCLCLYLQRSHYSPGSGKSCLLINTRRQAHKLALVKLVKAVSSHLVIWRQKRITIHLRARTFLHVHSPGITDSFNTVRYPKYMHFVLEYRISLAFHQSKLLILSKKYKTS